MDGGLPLKVVLHFDQVVTNCSVSGGDDIPSEDMTPLILRTIEDDWICDLGKVGE